MSKTYAALADTLGTAGADAIVAAYGGTHLYVGRTPNADLVQVIGAESAQRLAERHQGEFFCVPRRLDIERLKRNQAIVAARKAGSTMRSLTRQFRLTERHLTTILQAHKATDEPAHDAATVEPPTPTRKKRNG